MKAICQLLPYDNLPLGAKTVWFTFILRTVLEILFSFVHKYEGMSFTIETVLQAVAFNRFVRIFVIGAEDQDKSRISYTFERLNSSFYASHGIFQPQLINILTGLY